jgi:multiple sugar transport system substrate-binding protein
MSQSPFSRRRFLLSAGAAALGASILQACGQSASPTATSAPKQSGGTGSEKTGATPGSKAAATPATSGQTGSAGKGQVGVAIRADATGAGGWQRAAIEDFKKKNEGVAVEVTEVPYADMAKKQLAMLATDTMPDVVYSGIKWFHYAAFKGSFYALDDLVKTTDPGMDDFFKAAVEGGKLDGKLYALPIELNSGNQNIIIYNKTLLGEKGVKEPTDDWTLEEYASTAAKITEADKHIYGTNLLTGSYYDFSALSRCLGGDILSDDGKQFTLTTDPKATEAAKWETELRTVHNAAPSRADTEGLTFAAGQLGLQAAGIYSVIPTKETVADKFEWDVVLGPTGPDGRRGYEAFVGMNSIYAKTKNLDNAYALTAHFSSKEMATLSTLEYGYSCARISVWQSDELAKIAPIFKRAAAWMADPKHEGPFPMPYNLRFSELQDKWANLSSALFYGEVGFDEGMKNIQEECQAIVALPRG